MSREILFRGWCARNEKWIEGDVICKNSGILIRRRSDAMCFSVNSDTVCQYTGLKDKNGELIFDGDIVRTKRYGKDSKSGQNFHDYDIFQVQYKEASYWIENSTRRFALTDGIKDIEVIGNIFDNPEMLRDAAQYADQDGLMPAT